MDSESKEKLIEIIRQNECIYNPKHSKYKDKKYKILLWEKIGAMLGTDGIKARDSWRSLRDGYVRYKKHISGNSGSRKYNFYSWSSQLTFLDEALELRLHDNAIGTEETEMQFIEERTDSPEHSTSSQPDRSSAESPNPLSIKVETPYLEGPWTSNASYLSLPIHTNHYSEKRTEKFSYHEYDDVDHLFASYAKSFKKLSRKTQAELKIRLAKLFAEAELSEIGSEIQIKIPRQSSSVSLCDKN